MLSTQLTFKIAESIIRQNCPPNYLSNLPTRLPFDIAHTVTFWNCPPNYLSKLFIQLHVELTEQYYLSKLSIQQIQQYEYPPNYLSNLPTNNYLRSCPPRYLVKCPPNYPIICQICPSNYLLCPLNNPITCQIFPPNYLSRSSIQLPLKMPNQ